MVEYRQTFVDTAMTRIEPEPHKNIPLVEAALSYAQIGWPVFPLHGKIPFKNSRGFKDATTNKQQIREWWTSHPTANIGLATGERSGVIVLDIDPPEGHFSIKELQAKHAPLPDTRRSRTANKGLHYFFAYPQDGRMYNNVRLTRFWGRLKRGS